MKNKFRRIIATTLSVLLIGGVVSPVDAGAQPTEPYDPITHLGEAYSYAYGGLLDLRLLEGLLTVGENGRTLSAAELAGVEQIWRTAVHTGQAPNGPSIDLDLLELIYLDLGVIQIPLLGSNGLLDFVLEDAAVGALREYASAPSPVYANGAVGVVSDQGALEVTQPGEGANANINLLSLLNLSNGSLTPGVIDAASLELGALSAAAEKPDQSQLGDTDPLCKTNYSQFNINQLKAAYLSGDPAVLNEEHERICSSYQIADALVVVDAPVVGGVVTTLQNTLDVLLLGVESSLNGLLGTGGVLDALYSLPVLGPVINGVVDISVEVDIPITDITQALLADPLKDSTGLISIDLSTGEILVDVKMLHAGNLNNLDPNTSLITDTELLLITETVTNLLSASKEDEPDGLNARLDRILRGENNQGGLYATEIVINSCVLGLLGICLVEADITTTLGGLLNSSAKRGTLTQYQADPYNYYYVDGLLGVVAPVIKPLLGGVGSIVEGLLFGTTTNPGGLLSGLLGNLQTAVLTPVITSLAPVLDNVIAPLANIIINRQKLQEVNHGSVFTVSAIEVNVLDLGSPTNSLLHLPLATAAVMAQHWTPVAMDFNVAKTGDGRNLHTGDYTYDMLCELDGTVIFDRTNPTNLQYAAPRVGTGFNSVGAANDLELVGASETGGLSEEIPLPEGAVCSVIANPSLELENFVALRPTGTTPTRTPYTYFLASDGSGISISDALSGDTNSWTTSGVSVGPGTEVVVNTDSVTDVWKNHSLSFEIANATTSYDINIVHAYDIDTRDIVVTKGTDGPAPAGETYNFQYSLDDGTTWVSDPVYEINDGGTFTITDVPLIDSTTLNPTSVLVREEVSAPTNGGPDVNWNLDGTSLTPATPSHDGTHARSSAFVAGAGLTTASATTPDLALNVINAYPVSVDFEAMLPATGATSLVWVLGLGLLIALAALGLYVNSRRK